MMEQKTKAEVAQLLLKTADSLSGLADSVRALYASLADSPQAEAKEAPAKEKQRETTAVESRPSPDHNASRL